MIRRTILLPVVVLVVMVAVAACGGGGAQPTAAPPPTEPPAEMAPSPTPEPMEEPSPTPEPTAAASPTPEPAAETGAQLVIWADENRAPIMQELAEEFKAQYGVELVVQQVSFGDLREQFKVAAPAGEGPDIIIGAHDWLGELVVNGLIAPLDLGDQQDQFLDVALQAFSYDGQLYGMPYLTENVAFFYNPDLVPEPPTTWSEVREIAAQLQEEGQVTQGYVLQVGDPYHFYPIMTAFGGYVFGRDEKGSYNPDDLGIDSEGSIAAATWLDQMVKDGLLSPDVDWDTMHAMFENGESAMFITGPWALSRIRDSGVNYAIAPIPDETADGKPFMGVHGFMISAFSQDPLLAQAFLTEFVATEEVMQKLFEADPRPSAFLSVREAIDDPDIAAFGEAGQNADPMPAIPEMASVWEAWGNAVTLIFQQQEDPEAAFKAAAEQIRAAIAGQ
ncbi:MAG: extracellular solute-binding protein [Ardenticatenia bacterium]|nr:extracellular solute-binding protein [Ardenticatenia bacterium]